MPGLMIRVNDGNPKFSGRFLSREDGGRAGPLGLYSSFCQKLRFAACLGVRSGARGAAERWADGDLGGSGSGLYSSFCQKLRFAVCPGVLSVAKGWAERLAGGGMGGRASYLGDLVSLFGARECW